MVRYYIDGLEPFTLKSTIELYEYNSADDVFFPRTILVFYTL